MYLSPLQSRLAASLLGSVLLVLSYYFLFAPRLALAADVHYGPAFALMDDDAFEMTQPEVQVLVNNVPQRIVISPGHSAQFVFEPVESTSDPPQDPGDRDRAVFVSANTCQRPEIESDPLWKAAPQLELSVSTDVLDNSKDIGNATIMFTEGAVMYQAIVRQVLYVTVTAPITPAGFSGIYSLDLAASMDDWFHSYQEDDVPQLTSLASDSTTALLRTRNLGLHETPDDLSAAEYALEADPPYVLFAEKTDSARLSGIRHSFCGLQIYAQMSSIAGDENAMVAAVGVIGPGHVGEPGYRFHVQNLDPESRYTGILVHTGRRGLTKRQAGQIGGGGHVFQQTQFTTNTTDNCRVITGLSFCNDTHYAVPANMVNFSSVDALAAWYDQNAQSSYTLFQYNLMQIPCEVAPDQQYSLVRSCDDCANAYKRWLCAVAIPRCEDFNSNHPFAIPRNVMQAFPNRTSLSNATIANFTDPAFRSSRNPVFDCVIAPGPYREILPCDDLCFDLAQSCAAGLGFTCPLPGTIGYNGSYASRIANSSEMSCNAPGSSYISAANILSAFPSSLLFLVSGALAIWIASC